MAEGLDDSEVKEGAKAATLPLVPLVIAILIAVLFSVGLLASGAFWLLRSGKLSLAGANKAEPAVKTETVKGKMVPLDPLLVNLADEGGHAYLRVGIVLREEEPQLAKGEKPKNAKEEKPEKGKATVNESDVMLRDAALTVVGRETAVALLATDGKERLREELRKAMQERSPEVKLMDVLFTEFLVQR